MKQIVCPNCGANDFVLKDGYKVCSYCDTKFEIKNKTKVAVSLKMMYNSYCKNVR